MTAVVRCTQYKKRPNKQSEQRQRGGAGDRLPRKTLEIHLGVIQLL